MVIAMVRLTMLKSFLGPNGIAGQHYLQKDGITLAIVPSDITERVTKTRDREIGSKNRRRHLEEELTVVCYSMKIQVGRSLIVRAARVDILKPMELK